MMVIKEFRGNICEQAILYIGEKLLLVNEKSVNFICNICYVTLGSPIVMLCVYFNCHL